MLGADGKTGLGKVPETDLKNKYSNHQSPHSVFLLLRGMGPCSEEKPNLPDVAWLVI
jgi:hypothetical protein